MLVYQRVCGQWVGLKTSWNYTSALPCVHRRRWRPQKRVSLALCDMTFCSFGTPPGLCSNFWGKAACHQQTVLLIVSFVPLTDLKLFILSTKLYMWHDTSYPYKIHLRRRDLAPLHLAPNTTGPKPWAQRGVQLAPQIYRRPDQFGNPHAK